MKKVNSGMLSFAKEATLMFAVVVGMTTLYSCSDKIDMTGGASETPVMSEKLHVANSDNSRVTNYKSLAGSASSATRAESFSMPAAPAVPADAIEITTDSPTLEAGKNYVIKSGVTLNAMNFLTADANIYIESGANVTFSNMWTGWPAGNLAIYILDGANVTDKMKITNVNNVTLYNYSENYRLSADLLYIQPTSAFYTNTDIDLGTKRIENNGVFYAGGNVTISDLISGSNAKWYFVGDMTAMGVLQFSHNTSAVFEGKVVANELNTNSACDAQFNCSAVFATRAVINNNAKVTLNGGLLQSPYVELNSSANLLMADGSKVETDLFYFANTANQYWNAGSKLILNSGFAVVQTKKFATDAPDLTYAIIVNEGQLGLVYDKCGYKNADSFNGNNGDQLSTISNVAHNEEGYTNVAQSECVPTGTPTDPEDKPYLDHIADVTTDHNHDISATCVYVNGSNAYVSYHNHGTSLHGCLEALSIDKAANTVTLLNYLESESQRDFNHLTVDNGFVLASGNDSNKGGIIAKAPLSGAGFGANGSADSLEVVRVIGTTTDGKYSRDANSIVRSGDNYLISSTEGFATYNATDFATVGMKYINEADVTASRGKFISLDKNNSNSVVALALNDIVDNKATYR